MRTVLTLAGLVWTMAGPSLAGEQPKLQAADRSALRYTNVESSLRLEGSNTIHDWVVVGREINCSLKAGSDLPAQLRQSLAPKEVKVWCEASIPVKSLKSIERDGSPHSSKFDEIMYERLDAANHPTIRFRLGKLVQTGVQEGNDVFDASGDLVIRNITNTFHMPLRVTIMPSGRLKMAGHVKAEGFRDFAGDCLLCASP